MDEDFRTIVRRMFEYEYGKAILEILVEHGDPLAKKLLAKMLADYKAEEITQKQPLE